MNGEVNVVWKKGDREMPPEVKHVVDVARGEALLRSLELPEEVANEIRYNADKCSQTINNYVSEIVVERLVTAS